MVPSIVIDDGNQAKTRREALMNQEYHYIGLAVHENKEFDYQVLILLANDVEQVVEPTSQPGCQCLVM